MPEKPKPWLSPPLDRPEEIVFDSRELVVDRCELSHQLQWPFRGVVFVFPKENLTPLDRWGMDSIVVHGQEQWLGGSTGDNLELLLGFPVVLPTSPPASRIVLGLRNWGPPRRIRIALRGRAL